jgi:hypothetical protein
MDKQKAKLCRDAAIPVKLIPTGQTAIVKAVHYETRMVRLMGEGIDPKAWYFVSDIEIA